MTIQLSARDWLDLGLKVLARHGFAALKADRLAKTMGVSRGSFYWHFADIAAFHGAILKHWREVAAEQVIADLEAGEAGEDPLARLLTRVLSERLTLEKAVRSWASFDAAARAAVQAIDRRRLGYLETMLKRSGLAPEAAQVRAQLLYWTFLGVTFSDKPPPDDIRQALLDELLRFARS
ncbi:TetR/AcrR family transcriptional regulator [Bradyrhizobium sp.]|uniref:TetR/AcrR family transcriptional regulator n=3 Tax=Bradyrhizobium sp. TaxID=376 RepID=UPI001D4B36E7|nr:TetR/AcrR family transcriptional regulator [Bradyrhizobium sp.]MBV8698527.1 TetR/AcrR family transcriptional regulator [Bradyrhizobium sp.]MBV8920777.1 TetR/AcrR family transcriptional regulator [Bradyrhizobium sp.]